MYDKNPQKAPHIYTFQETHSNKESEKFLEAALPGTKIYSHGDGTSRGIVLGLMPSFKGRIVSSVVDEDRRYIIAKCEIGNQEFVIVSVYIPVHFPAVALSELLSKIADIVQDLEVENVIWCGDFNVVIDPNLDAKNTNHHPSEHSRKRLAAVMDAHDLTDVWRALNPYAKRFTCFSKVHSTLTRLDYMLASPSFMTAVTDMDIGASFQLDHSPLYLSFSFDSETRGRAHWKFPNFLVHHPELKGKLVALIQDIRKTNGDTEPGLLWDTIKAAIRGEAIKFLGETKRKRRHLVEALETEIAEAICDRDRAQSEDMRHHYSTKTDRLQMELTDVYTKVDAQINAYRRAHKYYETGRPTQYFLANQVSKTDFIKSLATKNGETVTESQSILQ